MIVSLRGLPGSGRSFVRQAITECLPRIGNELKNGDATIVVIAAETMRITQLYDTLWSAYDNGFSALYEGVLNEGTSGLTSMFSADQCAIVVIDAEIDACMAAIRERGGSTKRETMKRLRKKLMKDCDTLVASGYNVFRVPDRTAALKKCMSLLAIC